MIALINPPNPPGRVSNKDTMGGLGQLLPSGSTAAFPPLDLPNLAALLRSKERPFVLVDCLGSKLDSAALVERLRNTGVSLLAVRTSTPSFESDLVVARTLKRELDQPVVLFGPQVSLFPERALGPETLGAVDAIVIGEAEFTLLELAETGDFASCRGLHWRNAEGQFVENERRPAIEDLDTVPFPAWDLLPYHEYEGGTLMHGLQPFVPIESGRGCPFKCGYCPYPVVQGHAQRTRSPENVAAMLDWLAEELGVRSALFRDPEFAHQKERVFEICAAIERRGVKLRWRCETRMENITEELVVAMAGAGCLGINFGLESADVTVLKNVKRKVMPLEKAKRAIALCHKHGIDTFCFFILGLPGETKQTALATLRYARELSPARAQFTVATPYPGTELRKWAEEHGFIEAAELTSFDPAMRNEDMSLEDLAWLQRFAGAAWETRPGALARRLWRHPLKAPRTLTQALMVHRQLAATRT